MNHHDIEELLGAYALDAVDPDEARVVEEHLKECARCRSEVAAHRETAALLSRGGDAPEGVWDRIASELEDTPPPISMEQFRTRPSMARGVSTRAVALLSAAAVVVIAVLAAQVFSQSRQIERLAEQAALSGIDDAIVSASADSASLTVELASADGRMSATVLVLRNRGYIVGGNLPPLDEGQTYQLWAKDGEVLLSVGVLGSQLERMGFALGEGTELLAITVEQAPGVVSTTNAPVVAGHLPEASA